MKSIDARFKEKTDFFSEHPEYFSPA